MNRLVALVAVLLVTACVAEPPPPLPPAAPPPPPPAGQTMQVPVLIATDRPKFDNRGVTDASYGEDVNTPNLQYGLAIAELPLCHDPGLLKRLAHKLFGVRINYSPTEDDVRVFNVWPLADKDAFVAELKSELQKAKDSEVFIFVHGYNTTLHDGIKEAAWLKFDLQLGPVVLYSWPSDGRVLAFYSDVDLALASAPHLELLLMDLANSPNIKGIHVLAHSLGCARCYMPFTTFAIIPRLPES